VTAAAGRCARLRDTCTMPRALLLLLAAHAGLRVGASFVCDTSLGGRSAAVCAALGDLYSATTQTSSWAKADGWSAAATGASPAPDYCGFYGVKCDANGLLTELCVRGARQRSPTSGPDALARRCSRLPGNLLLGNLPASLANLSSLAALVRGLRAASAARGQRATCTGQFAAPPPLSCTRRHRRTFR